MAHTYRAVSWNRFKKRYDLLLGLGIVLWLGAFMGLGLATHHAITAEILMLRATGAGALVLLHVILAIGPLCRLQPRFLPLLYNRRHLGVAMFALAFVHGLLATMTYHFGSDVNVFVSIFTSDTGTTLGSFPFQTFGFVALLILFLMAATSHDFWLRNLTAPVWKTLHMGVYLAYALLMIHVAFGVLQSELHPGYVVAFAAGFAVVGGLHFVAAGREAPLDRPVEAAGDGFVPVCAVDEILEGRARIILAGGERVAVFKHEGHLSAVSNVCKHQNGPLGEGRIVDGCITCPWHGYQYEPANGTAPAPFTEKLPTFNLRLEGDTLMVDPRPNPPGTHVDPLPIPAEADR